MTGYAILYVHSVFHLTIATEKLRQGHLNTFTPEELSQKLNPYYPSQAVLPTNVLHWLEVKAEERREKDSWRDKSIEKPGDFHLEYEQSYRIK